jgi:hypothetical protein
MPEELRVIGVELDRVGQRWLELRAQDREAYAAWNRECEARGLPRLDFESVPHEQSLQRAQERNAVPKPGITADEAWDNLHFELLELTERALVLRPRTLAGVAVQLRAIALIQNEMWTDAGLDASEHDPCRVFIENLAVFLKIEPEPIQDMRDRLGS